MKKPRICTVIINRDPAAIREIEPLTDLFEVRIDLIGDSWKELVKQLNQPWIACNRCAEEGGSWEGDETSRIEELLQATELGAEIIDIELRTRNLESVVKQIKKNKVRCILSFHELERTPPLEEMREIVNRQLGAGADICKVVTTAQRLEDNLAVLQLITEFPKTRIVSFAMGPLGLASRVLCPLIGGDFTYASTGPGKESAAGQMALKDLRKIYRMMRHGQ